jgi:hypothetical protein
MKKEFINLVYIRSNANIKGIRIIKKLIEYGGNNVGCLSGESDTSCYFITPENAIYGGSAEHLLPILKLAGYRDITAELEVTEYTIEEIAKLLGKDPDSIRIKK